MLGLNNVGPTQRRVPLLGVLPAGLGEGVGDCRDVDVTQKGVLIGSSRDNFEGKNQVLFFKNVFLCYQFLLSTPVTIGSPPLVTMMYPLQGILEIIRADEL